MYRSQSDSAQRSRARILALLAAAVLLSGCRGGTESQSDSTPGITASVESVESAAPESAEYAESAESADGTPAVTVEPSSESGTSDVEQTEQTDNTAESTESTESSEPPAPETESAPASPAVSTEPPAPQTTDMSIPAEPDPPLASTPPATSATTASTTPKPPAEVIIPDVKTMSSPGTKTFTAGNSVIDYSNASLGYFSVKYGGKSDKIRLRVICGSSTYDYMPPADGTTRYYPLSCGSGEYTLQLWEHDHDNLYANPINETVSFTVSDEVSMFLYPNYYVNFNQQSNAVKKSAEVCAGKEGTIEKIAAIFGYITDNVVYDKQLAATVQSGYVPNPDATLKSLKGICFDYSALFAAMTRAQGIPTRLVIGYASPDIYHAWNEVYTTETGWITPELFLKQNGYNLLDSTFYAGASDKAQIADYISTKSNYTALYYY